MSDILYDILESAIDLVQHNVVQSEFCMIEEPGSNLCIIERNADFLDLSFYSSEMFSCSISDNDLKFLTSIRVDYTQYCTSLYSIK